MAYDLLDAGVLLQQMREASITSYEAAAAFIETHRPAAMRQAFEVQFRPEWPEAILAGIEDKSWDPVLRGEQAWEAFVARAAEIYRDSHGSTLYRFADGSSYADWCDGTEAFCPPGDAPLQEEDWRDFTRVR